MIGSIYGYDIDNKYDRFIGYMGEVDCQCRIRAVRLVRLYTAPEEGATADSITELESAIELVMAIKKRAERVSKLQELLPAY